MLATASGCAFEVERGPDWLLVRLLGPDDLVASHPPLADALWSLLHQHFTYRVVLELDQVDILNSYLISQLVTLHKRVVAHDGVMRLCGLSAHNRRVLRTCRLHERLATYDDRQAAVMAGCGPRLPR